MRLGWGRDDGPFFLLVPRTQAARALQAGAHSTLHGVVFAILCLGSAVYRRRGAALRPGHEIVSASRSRRIDPTPMHHALGFRLDEHRIVRVVPGPGSSVPVDAGNIDAVSTFMANVHR